MPATLPRDLERFATAAAAAGRYRTLDDVVVAGVSLLQRQEADRAEFVASLEAAKAEGERDGWHTAGDVHAEVTALIDGRTVAFSVAIGAHLPRLGQGH